MAGRGGSSPRPLSPAALAALQLTRARRRRGGVALRARLEALAERYPEGGDEMARQLVAWAQGLAGARPGEVAGQAARAAAAGIEVLALSDPRYPARLRAQADPPPALFVRGEVGWLAGAGVAVVGGRGASPGAVARAELLGRGVGRGLGVRGQAGAWGAGPDETGGQARATEEGPGARVVLAGTSSPCERGAARGALGARGPVVLVEAYGLDALPAWSHVLVRGVLDGGGAAVSAAPPGVGYYPGAWQRRNRLLGGLAAEVVVAWAREGSGCLEAVDAALVGGAEVWVPDPKSASAGAGARALAGEGARIFTDPLEVLGLGGAVNACPGGDLWRRLDQGGPLAPDAALECMRGAPDRRASRLDSMLAGGWLRWTGDGRLARDHPALVGDAPGGQRGDSLA